MRHVSLIPAVLVIWICLTSRGADAALTRSPYLFRQADASAPTPVLPPGSEVKYRDAGDDRIPDQYIVVLSDDVLPNQVPDVARDLGLSHQFTPRKVWRDAIKGFSAAMPEARARALSHNPHVKYVEENAEWHLSGTGTQKTNINPVTCDPTLTTCTGTGVVTDNRLWHLDRADQNYPDPTTTYSYCTDGTGVTAYVVDTGVNKYHQEFGARVMPGYNATATTSDAATNDHMPADDPCLGFVVPPNVQYPQEGANYFNQVFTDSHGTAVASALGGARVGIAKNVTIVPVKVRRCDVDSSRVRLSSHDYLQNQTMFRTQSGYSYDAIYRCISNGGKTLGSDPGGWSVTPGATIVDGTVTWKVLDPNEYRNLQATDMLIDGLNWVLSADNTGPKSYAIVTLSQYRRTEDIAGTRFNTTVEAVLRTLVANNITVVASANNQNGNACDTSPSRISIDNPDPTLKGDVITAGGSMMINRPWNVNLSEPPAIPPDATEADGEGIAGITKGREIAYDATKAGREGRWICGEGDSDKCSNSTSRSTPPPRSTTDPPDLNVPVNYYSFTGGSNAGPCVTLFAPAKNLFLATATGSGSDYRDGRLHAGWASGTSWSAPIVAGFAARILQGPNGQGPNQLTPAQVRTVLLNNSVSTLDADTLNTYDYTGTPITGTPNKLLRLGDVNITLQPVTQAAALSGPTTLFAQASGTSTVSYQWYQVSSTFDLVRWKSGAHYDTGSVGSAGSSSTAIAGATSNTYQAPAVSVIRGYWMRATNSCGSADTDIAVVVPRPGAPSNVIADSNGTASVTIAWSSGSGAEKYDIQRKVSGQPWTRVTLVNSGTSTWTDVTPTAAGGMLVYRVLSVAGTAYLQDGSYATTMGNNDIANVSSIGYEGLTAGTTKLKAQHLIELRQAVNALCDAAGVSHEYLGSEVQLSALQGHVAAASDFDSTTGLLKHINNIRQNGLIGMPAATFGVPPTPGATIAAANLQSLRDALR